MFITFQLHYLLLIKHEYFMNVFINSVLGKREYIHF